MIKPIVTPFTILKSMLTSSGMRKPNEEDMKHEYTNL